MKSEPICYTKKCANKPSHKWHPNKNKGHLHVCKEHFDLLTQVFDVETIGEEDGLTVVRVIPESEK